MTGPFGQEIYLHQVLLGLDGRDIQRLLFERGWLELQQGVHLLLQLLDLAARRREPDGIQQVVLLAAERQHLPAEV